MSYDTDALNEWSRTNGVTDDTSVNQLPECYYDPGRQAYWVRNQRDEWTTLNSAMFKNYLRSHGLSGERHGPLSEVEDSALYITTERAVDYAAPLAGWPAGHIESNRQRILVTNSSKPMLPAQGEWSNLSTIFQNMLCDGRRDQRPFLFSWLQCARKSLHTRIHQPGQVLVLAGDADSGKTFMRQILTTALGGRSAKPYQYMTGKTNFNADLFVAEVLVVDDEQASTDIRARREFGSKVKELLFSRDQRCHAKGRQAVTLYPFWRMIVCTNSEPENLMVLPPLDESLEDKFMLLKISKKPMPMATDTPQARDELWAVLMRELPPFLHFVDNEWQIPTELVSQRCGTKHYHHPDLVEALAELTPEARLLNFIDAGIFKQGASEHIEGEDQWCGTAEDLQHALRDTAFSNEAKSIFTWHSACGTYLARLQKQKPNRVSHKRTNAGVLWTINRT